jgi:hypothetical protein
MARRILEAALAIAMIAPACSSPRPASQQEDRMDRATVEQLGHVTLPASATHLQAHAERGIDGAVWARFDLPAGDVDGFLAGAGYAELSSTQRAVENWHLPTKAAWWTPDALTTFRSGKIRRESGKPRYAGHVLVGGDGQGDGATKTVYLFVTGL